MAVRALAPGVTDADKSVCPARHIKESDERSQSDLRCGMIEGATGTVEKVEDMSSS